MVYEETGFMKVLTVSNNNGLQSGDIVVLSSDGARWQRLARLLLRPRITVVDEVTATTVTLRKRRLTWREWRQAIWSAII